MRCQVVKLSIVGNIAAVTMFTNDLAAFQISKEYEVSLTELPPMTAPVNTETAAPDNVVNLSGGERPHDTTENILDMVTPPVAPPAADKPTPCSLCNGSGAVSVFEGDSNTGQVEACKACGGTGVQPLVPPPATA